MDDRLFAVSLERFEAGEEDAGCQHQSQVWFRRRFG